jgi:hypothetical protein
MLVLMSIRQQPKFALMGTAPRERLNTVQVAGEDDGDRSLPGPPGHGPRDVDRTRPVRRALWGRRTVLALRGRSETWPPAGSAEEALQGWQREKAAGDNSVVRNTAFMGTDHLWMRLRRDVVGKLLKSCIVPQTCVSIAALSSVCGTGILCLLPGNVGGAWRSIA